jgi:hypothetical protein
MSPADAPLRVTTAAEAAAVVAYFNAFHDGFIRRLTLVSHDVHTSRDVHLTTGRLDLEIVFAHCNYREGAPAPDQLVEARFEQIAGLALAFTGQPADWPILSLELGPAPDAVGRAPTFLARLVQPRLVDTRRWEHAEALTFGFASAAFREVPAPG